jgi:hypothetical protein
MTSSSIPIVDTKYPGDHTTLSFQYTLPRISYMEIASLEL